MALQHVLTVGVTACRRARGWKAWLLDWWSPRCSWLQTPCRQPDVGRPVVVVASAAAAVSMWDRVLQLMMAQLQMLCGQQSFLRCSGVRGAVQEGPRVSACTDTYQ